MSAVRTQIVSISSLLVGMAMLLIGNSLQGTLLAVRAVNEAFSQASIGVMASGYFLGFVLGTLVTSYLIERAGHIRGFTALASLASAAALGHIIVIDPVAWTIFRAISGMCFAGIYMVIESWLNERATNETRGQVLAAYMIVNLLALTAGQFLIGTADPNGYVLFCLISIIVSLAIIPVSITRIEAPAPRNPKPMPLLRLFHISPLGFVSCLAYGIAMGSFWALAPVFAAKIGLDAEGVAAFMGLCILGGGLMQWPMGRLSDRFDRRTVLTLCALTAGLAGIAVAAGGYLRPDWLAYLGFLFGAFAFPVYALSVSHSNDFVGAEERVAVSGTLLLIFGAGAVIGPATVAPLMQVYAPQALFLYIGAVFLFISAYGAWRMTRRRARPVGEQAAFVPAPTTTPVAMKLAPQSAPSPRPADQPPPSNPAS